MSTYRCPAALVGNRITGPVDLACEGGLIVGVEPALVGSSYDELLPGLVLPGFADAHSHVFHRALRGRTHGGDHGDNLGASGGSISISGSASGSGGAGKAGSFWSWRELMYALADGLTPETFHQLAVATYAEMLCAGFTAVGEFHYLHHAPGGVPYGRPNEMGIAAAAAAAEVGIGLTLLDAAYLAGGFGLPLGRSQLRFGDGSAAGWTDRVGSLAAELPTGRYAPIRVGAAIHSVRAVPVADLPVVAGYARSHDLVLHVHLSEQPAENDAALAATGRTPTRLLADAGALGPRSAVVHATHLTDADIAALGDAGCFAVICPTTEADLADGLPRAAALRDAGAALALGGDQHVVTDPFAQARGLEYGERLATGRRGTFSPEALLTAATQVSHAAVGSAAGVLQVGKPADFVAVRMDSARTAGSLGPQSVMTAAAADVEVVVVGGVVQARNGTHVRLGNPGALLAAAIGKAWST